MRERDVVWIALAGKRRPAVVLEVTQDLIRVAYGTSNERREWPGVSVDPRTRQGRHFPLTQVTYFYGANTAWAAPEELERAEQQCSYELFFEVRQVVEEHDAQAPHEDD